MEIDRSKLTEIAPGVFQKNEKTYYIECCLKGTLHYCNKERLDKLVKKVGTLAVLGSTYMSKVAKAELKAKEVIKAPVRKEKKPKVVASEGIIREAPQMKLDMSDEDTMVIGDNPRICMRRDIVQKERGYCNGCRWFRDCTVRQKKWAKKSNAPQRTEIREFTDEPIFDAITASITESVQKMKQARIDKGTAIKGLDY